MSTIQKTPKLYVWENYGLYLGTNYVPLTTYSVTSDQLLVVIEGELIREKPGGQGTAFRSVLIRAGTTIDMSVIDARTAVIAIFFLDPLGKELQYLQTQMRKSPDEFYYNHAREPELIQTCLWLRDNAFSIAEVEPHFHNLLIPPVERVFQIREYDRRAAKAMQYIRETITENLSIEDYAKQVHMSDSRLRKLFKSEFGIPITRYRLGYRIVVGVLHLAAGASITESALAAGFASTAHFSKCFRAAMGIHLSAMFLQPPFLDIQIDDAVIRRHSNRVIA